MKKLPQNKGIRTRRDCSIEVDIHDNIVRRVAIANYLNERVRYVIFTDQGSLTAGYIDPNTYHDEHIHTKLNNSSYVGVKVYYENDNIIIDRKRVTL